LAAPCALADPRLDLLANAAGLRIRDIDMDLAEQIALMCVVYNIKRAVKQ